MNRSHPRLRGSFRAVAAIFILAAAPLLPADSAVAQEELGVRLSPNSPSRIFSFTNKNDAFICGNANGFASSGFHGVTRNKEKLFETYWILAGDSLLDPRTAEVTVTPSALVRSYPAMNIREELFFADSLTLLAVRITGDYRGPIAVLPAWASRYAGAEGAATQRWDYGSVSEIAYDIPRPVPCALVVTHPAIQGLEVGESLRRRLKNPAPFWCPMQFGTDKFQGELLLTIEFFASGNTPQHRAKRFVSELLSRKTARIRAELTRRDFHSSDTLFDRSVRWISASLDALVMKSSLPSGEEFPALYAGLPWFDDYWGRDTFISMPGTLLVNGAFEDAGRLLRLFARHQETNPRSPNYGRIPNRITPGETIYNTADGTPWFVRQLCEYVRYSGDKNLARELYPAVEKAIVGTRKFHVAASGFLAHGDAESWMDAVGENGSWSPRSDHAVEIQALWIDQLRSSAAIAEWAGHGEQSSEWRTFADKVAMEFRRRFPDREGVLADRIQSDGSPDRQIRPNALIAFAAPAFPEISDSLAFPTLKKTLENCVYPYGVASLSQFDPAFHPWHEYPGRYPKDAAYHNGAIWTWLTGPAVTLLCRLGNPDMAFRLTRSLELVSERQGQVGSLPELLDAIPRGADSIPNWSGTFSQTWSLAEFLRNLSQDYLGLRPDALARSLVIRPRMPSHFSMMESNCPVGASMYHVRADLADPRSQKYALRRVSGRDSLRVSLNILHRNVTFISESFLLHSGDGEVLVLFDTESHSFSVGGRRLGTTALASPIKPDLARSLSFCVPYVNPGLVSVKKPEYPLLEGAAVCSRNPAARVLFEKSDPAGDDTGPNGKYVYPKNAYFQPGIFDIRSLTVSSDGEMVYFTITMQNLVQPGWHPEYGFQLTMLALAIDVDGEKRSGSRYIRANSKWILPDDMWYERLILIGGGVQVQDKNGTILAEYIPTGEQYPIGDAARKTISFAIPVRCIGEPGPHWDYLLLAGGQDDHGGGGIGEFRTVLPEATEWNGGGNDRNGANIYDTLSSR